MRGRSTIFIIIVGAVLIIGLTAVFLGSADHRPLTGMLVFCQVPGDMTDMNYRTGGDWRYPSRARIVAVDPENPTGTFKVLTDEFYSARAPEISYDGKRLLFSGQRRKGEPWQIWEMDLEDLQVRQVTSGLEGSTDPAYLPDGRIVFSGLKTDRTVGAGHILYTCTLDGSDTKPITFHPHSDFASTVLQEGRLLTISRQLYPAPGAAMLMVLRPDGTKAELFYENREDGWPSSRVRETDDGQMIFVESDRNHPFGGEVVAISRNRPLHSKIVLTAEIEGEFHSAFPLPSGKLVVSYRKPGVDRFALFEFDPVKKRLGRLIYSDPEYHALEPVMVAERPRPKKLPSIVNEQKTTGSLLCLNSDLSDLPADNHPSSAKKVQVSGIGDSWGEAPVAEDGSFYVEIKADTPVRFRTVNEEGRVIRGPSAWIWVRPGERRGCIGCHEDPELAPENRVPLAVNKPPVALSKR
ncbi:MAG: hypothetical protein GXO92_04450 [FCB group bacterium]|nr:hypothetical protein [FCB group bacterium]